MFLSRFAGGFREAAASISGEDVYGILKYENGVHRVSGGTVAYYTMLWWTGNSNRWGYVLFQLPSCATEVFGSVPSLLEYPVSQCRVEPGYAPPTV